MHALANTDNHIYMYLFSLNFYLNTISWIRVFEYLYNMNIHIRIISIIKNMFIILQYLDYYTDQLYYQKTFHFDSVNMPISLRYE